MTQMSKNISSFAEGSGGQAAFVRRDKAVRRHERTVK